ncbi:MAG: hypothetical protein ACTFAL_12470 [Candidatus Electronema sp. V4]|uniref:hypothetical protein n=1 Tax=Candidatus Electronema sp. V4 TaxID=3454756 RepID=UPI0040558801
MTESEAREKWCPFSREAFLLEGSDDCITANRLCGNPSPGSYCLGSACMAWNENEGCMMMRRPFGREWRRTEAVKNA